MAKGGDTISSLTGLPTVATSAAFSVLIGSGCFFLSAKALDTANTVLVGFVILSFLVCPASSLAAHVSGCSWLAWGPCQAPQDAAHHISTDQQAGRASVRLGAPLIAW